jgi:hypothetical protein
MPFSLMRLAIFMWVLFTCLFWRRYFVLNGGYEKILSCAAAVWNRADLDMNFMFMIPYILVIYIFDWESNEMHVDSFRYSLFHYTCSTCFGCYLLPSSGAQTAEYSRRYVLLLWFAGTPSHVRTTSLDTTRPSTIFYRHLLNWASLRRN